MSGIDDRLRQGITAESSVRRPEPSYLRSPSPRINVFIELDIENAYEDPQDFGILVLKPGGSYLLTLSLSSASYAGAGPAFCLRGREMRVSLRTQGLDELTLKIKECTTPEDSQSSTLTRDEVETGREIQFSIELPIECPRRRGFIQVVCGLPGAEFNQPCLERAVRVDGTYFPWDAEEAKTWHIDPTAKPPAHMAFLYAELENSSFVLQGRHHLEKLQKHDIGKPPSLSLASLIEAEMPARDIVAQIRVTFSCEKTLPLLNWLHALLNRYPETLLVAIVDLSGAEVPWELIRLSHRRYLGGEADVVRWATLWEDSEPIALGVGERTYEGHAIGFLDARSLGGTNSERDELALLGAQQLDSLSSVKNRLLESLEWVSLMYLACHGEVHLKQGAHRYHALQTEEEDLVHLEIENMERRLHRIPTIFVNACGSGRFFRDDNGDFGLALALLRKVANGYIGTLGKVNSEHAGEIGRKILRAFRTAPDGTRPSRCLRQIRKEAAAAHDPERSDDEGWLRFLSAFMYVYYGEPFAQVKVRPYRGEQP